MTVPAPAVYRGYDQPALDAQYDNQAKISKAGFREFLARCAAASAAARSDLPCVLDVAYGSHPAETLYIFPARGGAGGTPVEIFFHGGYWRMLDKRDFSYVAAGFVPHGTTTLVVNYGLVPAVTLDELVSQCRRAVAWACRHVHRYGGDPARLHLSGHSAGGHLVAMMLATDWRQYGLATPAPPVRSATAISGIYELEPVRLSFLNRELGLSAPEARRNSPVYLRPTGAVPLLLPVGGREGEEYARQSRALADAWRTGAGSPECVLFDNDDHFSMRAQLGTPDSPLLTLIMSRRGGG